MSGTSESSQNSDQGDSSVDLPEDEPFSSYVVPNIYRLASIVLGAATALSVVPVLVQLVQAFDMSVLEQALASTSLLMMYLTLLTALTAKDVYADLNRIRRNFEMNIRRLNRRMRSRVLDINDTFFGLAFSILLYEPPDTIDTDHYLTFSESNIDLTDGRVVFTEQFRGYNASNDSTQYLPILITGESRIGADDLNFEMWYNDGDEFVPQDGWEAESLGKYEVLIKLVFPEELQPDDEFNVKYRSRAGEWPMEEDQYIFIPQHRFARGTERFVTKFCLDTGRNISFDAQKVVPDTLSHFRSPQRVNFEMTELGEEVSINATADRTTEIRLVEENTQGLYLFRFDT